MCFFFPWGMGKNLGLSPCVDVFFSMFFHVPQKNGRRPSHFDSYLFNLKIMARKKHQTTWGTSKYLAFPGLETRWDFHVK